MPGLLARSRSLRILRGGHKETHQLDHAMPTPPPTNSSVDIDRLKATTPVTSANLPVETPDMLQRPKTSGGSADRGKLFHKKTYPIVDQTSQNSFPSPSKSTTTLIYTAEFHESREGFIGIALGSPTMAPNWSATQSTDFVPNTHRTVTEITSNPPSIIAKAEEVQKPKLSRWKSIFGKKSQPAPEPKPTFYQLAQSVAPTRADSHHDNESLDSRTTPQYGSTKEIVSTSPPAFKPEIRESRRLPKGFAQPTTETRPRALTHGTAALNPNPLPLRSTSNNNVLTRNTQNDSPTVPQLNLPKDDYQSPSSIAFPSNQPRMDKPLLDVDIPTIKMERYSVMFGNLLQSGTESSLSNRSSSLLVRRQGAERLKPLNELSMKSDKDDSRLGVLKPQRRATSPTMAPKSPFTLSLFPQPGTGSRAPSPRPSSTNRARVIQRSKTMPSSSPNRQSFSSEQHDSSQVAKVAPEKPQDTKPKAITPVVKATKEVVDLNQKSQLLSPSTLSSKSFSSGPDEVSAIKSPSSANPWRAQRDEPEWEVVSKPTRRPSHRELKEALSSHPTNVVMEPPPQQQTRSAPLEKSRVMGTTSKPSTPLILQSPVPRSADRLESSPRLRTQGSLRLQKSPGLTVGVARSVSVSRASPRNGEMLKPMLIRRGTDSPEKLVDKRALTPTLVELKDRRSQRVQLVDA